MRKCRYLVVRSSKSTGASSIGNSGIARGWGAAGSKLCCSSSKVMGSLSSPIAQVMREPVSTKKLVTYRSAGTHAAGVTGAGHKGAHRTALLECTTDAEVRDIMAKMTAAGTPPKLCAWTMLLTVQRSEQQMQGVLAEMRAAGLTWNVISVSAGEGAVRCVLDNMAADSVSPNVATWSMIMKAQTSPSQMRAVMAEMRAAGVKANVSCWNILMSRCGSLEQAREVMAEMKAEGVAPDTSTWNTLLSSVRSSDKLRGVISDMQATGVSPKKATWNSLMTSYSEPDDVRAVMQEMRAAGVAPDVHSWSILIKACRHPPKVRAAMQEMRAEGVEPNVVTWTLLIRSYKNPEKMLQVMDEMLAAGVVPDSFFYSTLFTCLLKNGGAAEVLNIYQTHLSQNPELINNYVAVGVVHALALTGSVADVNSFWEVHGGKLQRAELRILNRLSRAPQNRLGSNQSERDRWAAVQALMWAR